MRKQGGELSAWKRFDLYVTETGPEFFGFRSDLGEVNRFVARFRAASSFQQIKFDGYSPNTQAGYSALCRVLFVYSAFEAWMEITGATQVSIGPALREYGAGELLRRVRALDSGGRFFRFISERVNKTHQQELENYFHDDPCNVAYLASAIRHIFAHGWLSPSAGGGESTQAVEICRAVSDFLLGFMDESFTAVVESALAKLNESQAVDLHAVC